jgi:hypothetical protein
MSGIEGLAASGLTSRSTLSRILPRSCSPSCASSMILAAMASLTPVSPFSLRSWQTLTNASVMASVVSGSNTGWPLMNGKILCMAHFLICRRYLIHGPRAVLLTWLSKRRLLAGGRANCWRGRTRMLSLLRWPTSWRALPGWSWRVVVSTTPLHPAAPLLKVGFLVRNRSHETRLHHRGCGAVRRAVHLPFDRWSMAGTGAFQIPNRSSGAVSKKLRSYFRPPVTVTW